MLKFALHDNYFFVVLTEVQIWYCESYEFGLRRFFRKIK